MLYKSIEKTGYLHEKKKFFFFSQFGGNLLAVHEVMLYMWGTKLSKNRDFVGYKICTKIECLVAG